MHYFIYSLVKLKIMKLKDSAFRLHPEKDVFMASGDALGCFLSSDFECGAVVFFNPPWSLVGGGILRVRQQLKQLSRKGIHVVLCCNERKEFVLARLLGIKSYFLNQNMHLPEGVYQPASGNVEKVYDAFYAAQARPFKRVHLAEQIERLFVLTYGCKEQDAQGQNDLHAFEPRISHCDYNKGFIHDKAELSMLMAQSHCGLCLSKREGAMWASMEYLMSGLPVVTTRNMGGRDHYFDKAYVKWVKATPEAVVAAVDAFKNSPVDANWIRETVLKKVKKDRKRFLSVLRREVALHSEIEFDYEYIWGSENGILDRHIQISML